ncbi:MAG: hypothetical protein ABFE07_22610, partial [Armatimonadia bacterium]
MSGHCEICGQTGCVDCEPTHATGGEVVNNQGATGCLEVDCDNTPETCKAGCGKHKGGASEKPLLVWDDMTKRAYSLDNTRIAHGAEFVLASDLDAVTAELNKADNTIRVQREGYDEMHRVLTAERDAL